MANYETLKNSVKQVIKTNGTQSITGQVLQNTLLSIISSVGANYQFVGIAKTSTNPGTPDGNVFYIAGNGTYPNFSGFTIETGQLGILKWNGKWSKETLEIGKKLTFDETPTEGSINPVTSRGIRTALDMQKSEVDAAKDEALKAIDKNEQEAIVNFNSQRVTPEMLSQSTIDLINASGGGSVTNLADDEDIESKENELGVKVLKFADRRYDDVNFSGKGYKILRKNIINGKNVLNQEMINATNTIYEIKYDFDLNGAEIKILEGCILKFDGGSLHNGTINGLNTTIQSDLYKIFYGVKFTGTFSNVFQIQWFVKKVSVDINNLIDCSDEMQEAFSSGVKNIFFTDNLYYVPNTININSCIYIDGNMKYNLHLNYESWDLVKTGIVTDKENTIFKYTDEDDYEKSLSIKGISIIGNYRNSYIGHIKEGEKLNPLIELDLKKVWNLYINVNICGIESKDIELYRAKFGTGIKIKTNSYIAFSTIDGNISGVHTGIDLYTEGAGWMNDTIHNGNCISVRGLIVNTKGINILRLNGKYQPQGGFSTAKNGNSFILANKCDTIVNSLIWDLSQGGGKYTGYTAEYAIEGVPNNMIINYYPLIPFVKNTLGNINKTFQWQDNLNVSAISDYAYKNKVTTNISLKNNGNPIEFTHNDLYKLFATDTFSETNCFTIVPKQAISQNDLDNITLEINIVDNNLNTLSINENFFYLWSIRSGKNLSNSFKLFDILIKQSDETKLLELNDIELSNNLYNNYNKFIYRLSALGKYLGYSISLTFKKLKNTGTNIIIFPIGISNNSSVNSIINGGNIYGPLYMYNAIHNYDNKKVMPFNKEGGFVGSYSNNKVYIGSIKFTGTAQESIYINGFLNLHQVTELQLGDYSGSYFYINASRNKSFIRCQGNADLSVPVELYYKKDSANNAIDIFVSFKTVAFACSINIINVQTRYNQATFEVIHDSSYTGEGEEIYCGYLSCNSDKEITNNCSSGKRVYRKDLKEETLFVDKSNGWVTYDGVKTNTKRSGTFAEKPTDKNGMKIGFAYFCTDKKTSEGNSNGIMIYYKGNNVWVDALGRIVS